MAGFFALPAFFGAFLAAFLTLLTAAFAAFFGAAFFAKILRKVNQMSQMLTQSLVLAAIYIMRIQIGCLVTRKPSADFYLSNGKNTLWMYSEANCPLQWV